MIKTVLLKTKEEITTMLMDQNYDESIGRIRGNYLFRGMLDVDYNLSTSLMRNCGSLSEKLEMPILNNFTKYAISEDPDMVRSVWRQMIVGQHHGLPTRLLDWTPSGLIALHFATSEKNFAKTSKRDSVVWRIDSAELSKLLPEKYQQVLRADTSETFTIRTLSSVAGTTEEYDNDMQDRSMAILEPPSTDQRIVNQYSYFSVVPLGIGDVEEFLDKYTNNTVKYIISRDIRWDIRDILDAYNVSERILFPGLDGLSAWIARHYYVKED